MEISDRLPQLNAVNGLIPRPALLSKLLRQTGPGLTVLAAPGGYGKTWLLNQIARAWPHAAPGANGARVWTLHSSSTPMQALRSFCALFGHHELPGNLDADAISDTALLTIALTDPEKAGTLIIDLDGAPPSKLVCALVGQVVLDYVTRGRVFVACRNPWSLPIDRVAMPSMQSVFRTGDLALSVEEILSTHAMDAEDAQRWLQLTEGWPVLCGEPERWRDALALGAATDVLLDRMVSQFGDYMEHALVAPLPPRDARLLMQVSIFDAIEPGVLQAVDIGAPWSRLSSLLESGIPVSLQQTDWDRIIIHPVFRRFLERRLFTRAAAQHHSLRRRAARYFATSGNTADALHQAVKTGDPSFEAQIIDQCGGWRTSLREGLSILGNSSAGSLDFSDRFPKAALARIYWQVQTGRIDTARRALASLRAQCQDEQIEDDLRAIDSVILVYRDEPFDEAQIRALQQLDAQAGEEEPLLLPGAATLQAAIFNNAGLYERGMLAARGAIAEAESLNSPYVEFYGRLHHASALLGLGRITEAIPELQCTRHLAEEVFGDASSELRVVNLLVASAAWQAGDDDPGDPSPVELSGLYRLHSWFEPYARVLQTAVAICRSRRDRALEDRVIEDFSCLAERRSLVRLKSSIVLARAQRARLDGQIESAESLCDTAFAYFDNAHPESPSTALALVPLWLERTCIALRKGQFDAASAALAQARSLSALIKCGDLDMEMRLLEAYVSLRSRRYREVAQLLSQCVVDAERTGLRRPFITHADHVGELVYYARTHALNIDVGLLQRAANLARLESELGNKRSKLAPAGGRLLLTERETDILHFLAEGLSSKEMARRLAIAEGTVKTHRKHLYEKLNTNLRSHAIVKARALGLL